MSKTDDPQRRDSNRNSAKTPRQVKNTVPPLKLNNSTDGESSHTARSSHSKHRPNSARSATSRESGKLTEGRQRSATSEARTLSATSRATGTPGESSRLTTREPVNSSTSPRPASSRCPTMRPNKVPAEALDNYKRGQGSMDKWLNMDNNKGYMSPLPGPRCPSRDGQEILNHSRGSMDKWLKQDDNRSYCSPRMEQRVKPEAQEIAGKEGRGLRSILGERPTPRAATCEQTHGAGRTVKPEAQVRMIEWLLKGTLAHKGHLVY